jgi:hypothetical protein
MIGLLCFGLAILISPFRSKSRLEAENAVLRHQLIVLRRKMRGRPQLTNNDRWFFIQLYRWFPAILQVLTIIRPDTLVRWHRAGFRRYWSWKSRPRGGRPQIETELRVLIRRMSVENPLWGAPRIHGELLKLGFELAQSSVAKYMVKRRGPPSQGWRTFLHNHAPDIAAMDLFVVPTIGFNLLYAFVIIRLDRRDLVWINVTTNPTAEWVAHQITEAFPWDEAPQANKRVQFRYGLNYLIDVEHAIIVDVEPTPARTYDEVASTKTMLERTERRLDLRPDWLAADTAYGTGKLLAWLLGKNIAPYIPVWERYPSPDGMFSRSDFAYDAERDVYVCPNDRLLRTSGTVHDGRVRNYLSQPGDCRACTLKQRCTRAPFKKIARDINEDARNHARSLKGTPAFERSSNAHKK